MTERFTEALWALRLKLAYWLVGDRSFVANVSIVGVLHMKRMTFGASMVRDIYISEAPHPRKRKKP